MADHLIHRHMQGGERRVVIFANHRIIEPGKGNILRQAQPGLLTRFRHANRHIVIPRQHAAERHIARQQLAPGLITAVGAPASAHQQLRIRLDSGVAQRLVIPRQTAFAGGRTLGTGDKGNTRMPLRQQIRHHPFTALLVVNKHALAAVAAQLAVDYHNRRLAGINNLVQLVDRQVFRVDKDRFTAQRQQEVDSVALLLRAVFSVRQHQLTTVHFAVGRRVVNHAGEERAVVEPVSDHQTDGVGFIIGKVARQLVWLVTRFVNRLHNAGFNLFADKDFAV